MSKLKDLIVKYKSLSIDLKNKQKISESSTIVAAKATEAVFKKRIFVEGKDSNGALIGDYSVKPMYINPAAPSLLGVKKSGLKPVGKNGQKKFKNSNPHKTVYLATGYKELRTKTGRQSAKVDLNLSGSLSASIQTGRRGQFVVLGYTSQKKFLIMQGNEQRFNKQIDRLSQKELDTFRAAAKLELERMVAKILKQNKL